MGQMFTFLTVDDRYSVPTLSFYEGTDLNAAREQALQDLRCNPHHQAIELRAGDRLLFVLSRMDQLETAP